MGIFPELVPDVGAAGPEQRVNKNWFFLHKNGLLFFMTDSS